MRGRARGPAPPGSSQDYLVSVSDLMSGLLFIFIITLAVFALRLVQMQEAAARTIQDLTDSQSVRKTIIEKIEKNLKREGVDVVVDAEQGIVRLTDKTVGFELNQADPRRQDRPNVTIIADTLLEVLRCYVSVPDGGSGECPDDPGGARVGTVMIEGHTDSIPIRGGRYRDNLELSSARSAQVLRLMTEEAPGLARLQNAERQPVLSVSGYGETRLLVPADEPTSKRDGTESDRQTDDDRHRLNRRIEIRLVMELPRAVDPRPVEALREAFAE